MDLTWKRPVRCDNSGPNCPEVRADEDGTRWVRNSQLPHLAVRFNAAEWAAFEESIRDGQRF